MTAVMKLTETLLLFQSQANALMILVLPYDAWKQNYFATFHLQTHSSPEIESERKTLKVCELASGSGYFKTGFQKDQSTVWGLSRPYPVPWRRRFKRSRP